MQKIQKKKKISTRRHSPYANIDWEKAKNLFQRPLPETDNHTYPTTKTILHLLAAAGTIGLMFAFPGAAAGIGALTLGNHPYDRWRTKQVLKRLAKQKFIKITETDPETVTVTITKNGLVRALTYNLDSMQIAKPKKWDHKWRVVIFDIPEKYKRTRDVFRMRLKQLGLYQLQDSVYVSPYRCFNEIEFLRELYGVSFTVQYLLVEKLEDDLFLKEHFALS